MSGKPHTIFVRTAIFLALVLAFTCTCKKETPGPQIPAPLTLTISTDVRYQTISGFGGANRMWGTQFLKPAEAKKAFGMDDSDLGMTIFRVRIASNPTEWPLILESVKEAQKYGAKIIAAPWSPPADLKSNNSDIGGYLLPANYEAFKDHLNAFIDFMDSNGVDIYAVSIQNEPDIQVGYESCDWTAFAMTDFIKDYGHLIQGAKITAPESFNFSDGFTNTLLNNTAAAANFDIVAGHIYGGGLGYFPAAEQKNKEIWMTEYLLNLNTGNSGAPAWTTYDESAKWNESLTMLNTIHEAMTYNWNAYVWWYLQRYYSFIGDGEQGTASGEILKRGYAFSQYSKYVRPGFVRVAVSTNKSNDLKVTAYQGPDQMVVVVLNPEDTPVNKFNIDAPNATSASATETSLSSNRADKAVALTDGNAILDIAAKSITTIVLSE